MMHTDSCNEPHEKIVCGAPTNENVKKNRENVELGAVDPAFVKQTKKKTTASCLGLGEDVFLVTSYGLVVVEMAAAFFTLAVIHFNISQSTVHKVTLGYYSLYCVLVSILIIDSLLSLKNYARERAQKKISSKEYLIKKIKEVSTVLSSVFWIALSIGSIMMEVGGGTPPFALLMFTLFLSLAAPAVGAFSAATRAYEVVYSSRQEVKRISKAEASAKAGDLSAEELEDLRERQTKKLRTGKALYLRSALFLVIAAFEFAHCLCHFVEAYYLVGETHHLFYITDKVLLGTQAALAILFLVLEGLEKYFEKKGEKEAELEASPTETPEFLSIDETDNEPEHDSCPPLPKKLEGVRSEPLVTPASKKAVA